MKQESHLETEVKILVPDLDAVRRRLEADPDAHLARPRVHEYNIRYEDAAGALTPAGIVLRLRRDAPVGGGAARVRLTYKAPARQESAGASTRLEYEVEVSDFEEMDVILRRLGYRPFWVYEKYRMTYTLAGAEVVLDETPFGAFVEAEGEPGAIEAALARLGLADGRRLLESYAVLFGYVKSNLGLPFDDLTFDNFRDISVPVSAFSPPGEG
jgi:adenylate cyclase class 2